MATQRNLETIHSQLSQRYGEVSGPPVEGPFQLILWEQVAYLADDEKRGRAFERLRQEVGLTPAEVLAADPERLEAIAAAGGAIAPHRRALRMRESAKRVQAQWRGDLAAVLRLPLDQAVRALAKFPMIGRPGAEKVLLFCGSHPVLALESNGLRALLRLGYGRESDERYDKTYRSVREAVAGEERTDCDWLGSLHRLLRRHGQVTCRNKQPLCGECPLTAACAYFAVDKGPPAVKS